MSNITTNLEERIIYFTVLFGTLYLLFHIVLWIERSHPLTESPRYDNNSLEFFKERDGLTYPGQDLEYIGPEFNISDQDMNALLTN